jgi:hypothetical protein
MKFSSYPLAAAPLPVDTFLIHQQASNSEQQVTMQSLISATKAFAQVVSIAALKAIDVTTITDGYQAMVSGYYTEADGGGGLFTYVAASALTDNGGYIIAPTVGAGRWIANDQAVINVKRFGAKGDGATDDTATITAAINSAVIRSVVFFPNAANAYMVSAQITLPISQLTILGFGATLKSVNDSAYRVFTATNQSSITIQGLTFNGVYLSTGLALAQGSIELYGCIDCTVQNCYFTNIAGQGVFISGACVRISVIDNGFNNCFCAIFSDWDTFTIPSRLTISRNRIRDGISKNTRVSFSGGIKLHGSANDNVSVGNIISENIITFPGQMGIEIQGGINGTSITGNAIESAGFGISLSIVLKCAVTGNTVKGSFTYGIEVASNCARCTVTGNTVDGLDQTGTATSAEGIICPNATSLSIVGNVLNTCNIHTLSSNTLSISSNTLRDGLINIQACYSVSIVGNTVVSNAPITNGIVIDISGDTGSHKGFDIIGNTFKGTFSFSIIRVYSGSGNGTIDGMMVCHNNTSGASGSGNAFDIQFGGSTSSMTGLVLRDNIASNDNGFYQDWLDIPVAELATSAVLDTKYAVILGNAAGGAITFTLPGGSATFPKTFTIKKIDSSANAITISGVIDGSGSYTLTAQNKYVTVCTENNAWWVIANN